MCDLRQASPRDAEGAALLSGAPPRAVCLLISSLLGDAWAPLLHACQVRLAGKQQAVLQLQRQPRRRRQACQRPRLPHSPCYPPVAGQQPGLLLPRVLHRLGGGPP